MFFCTDGRTRDRVDGLRMGRASERTDGQNYRLVVTVAVVVVVVVVIIML